MDLTNITVFLNMSHLYFLGTKIIHYSKSVLVLSTIEVMQVICLLIAE